MLRLIPCSMLCIGQYGLRVSWKGRRSRETERIIFWSTGTSTTAFGSFIGRRVTLELRQHYAQKGTMVGSVIPVIKVQRYIPSTTLILSKFNQSVDNKQRLGKFEYELKAGSEWRTLNFDTVAYKTPGTILCFRSSSNTIRLRESIFIVLFHNWRTCQDTGLRHWVCRLFLAFEHFPLFETLSV